MKKVDIQLKKKEQKLLIKKDVDIDELYDNWTKFSIASSKMLIIYMSYCSSNTVLKLKLENKIISDIQENKIIDEIVNGAFKGIDEKFLDNEKEELYYFIKLFVKRNKYYDEKYVR